MVINNLCLGGYHSDTGFIEVYKKIKISDGDHVRLYYSPRCWLLRQIQQQQGKLINNTKEDNLKPEESENCLHI